MKNADQMISNQKIYNKEKQNKKANGQWAYFNFSPSVDK